MHRTRSGHQVHEGREAHARRDEREHDDEEDVDGDERAVRGLVGHPQSATRTKEPEREDRRRDRHPPEGPRRGAGTSVDRIRVVGTYRCHETGGRINDDTGVGAGNRGVGRAKQHPPRVWPGYPERSGGRGAVDTARWDVRQQSIFLSP